MKKTTKILLIVVIAVIALYFGYGLIPKTNYDKANVLTANGISSTYEVKYYYSIGDTYYIVSEVGDYTLTVKVNRLQVVFINEEINSIA